MVILPKNTTNTTERVANGVERIMQYVCKQIEWRNSKNKTDDVVACVKDYDKNGKFVSFGVQEEFFPNDLIEKAMGEVKVQGYFVWHHKDYMGYNEYWVTKTDNRPHTWFAKF